MSIYNDNVRPLCEADSTMCVGILHWGTADCNETSVRYAEDKSTCLSRKMATARLKQEGTVHIVILVIQWLRSGSLASYSVFGTVLSGLRVRTIRGDQGGFASGIVSCWDWAWVAGTVRYSGLWLVDSARRSIVHPAYLIVGWQEWMVATELKRESRPRAARLPSLESEMGDTRKWEPLLDEQTVSEQKGGGISFTGT